MSSGGKVAFKVKEEQNKTKKKKKTKKGQSGGPGVR